MEGRNGAAKIVTKTFCVAKQQKFLALFYAGIFSIKKVIGKRGQAPFWACSDRGQAGREGLLLGTSNRSNRIADTICVTDFEKHH
jgi:hypothetical protein